MLAVLLILQPTIALAADLAPGDFINEVAAAMHTIGGLSTLGKVAVIITLLVSSLKVTALRDLVWGRLGAAQVLVAPFLALLAGLFGLGSDGAPLTPAVVVAYLTAGGGAILLHELLDAAKSLPGVGAGYLKAIALVEKALGAPPKQ